MVEPEKMQTPAQAVKAGSDLPLRAVSGLAMAALALVAAWFGGWIFIAFWSIAAIAILWEWNTIVAASPQRALWVAAGILYAAVTAIAPVVLRGSVDFGFVAIVFLFAVVWTTDIAGYVVGRLVGGAKLWPAVSPKKTWSGAIGGIIGAVIAGSAVVHFSGIPVGAVIVLAAVLSIASQGGDLFESAIKRRFGVKDASHILPGHGGVMDRLDGFIVAALVAALIGLARGGLMQPGRGLLVW
jgi:phosphatidate cytidylyltransferase